MKEALGGEREQSLELQSDLEAAQRENQQLVQELEESRQQHAEDKETWEEREKEYLQRVQDMTDNHLKLMEASKVRSPTPGPLQDGVTDWFVVFPVEED